MSTVVKTIVLSLVSQTGFKNSTARPTASTSTSLASSADVITSAAGNNSGASCNAQSIDWTSASHAWRDASGYYETFTTTTEYDNTTFSTKLYTCTSSCGTTLGAISYCGPTTDVISTTHISTEYVTSTFTWPPFPSPKPNCTIGSSDCSKLVSSFTSAQSSFFSIPWSSRDDASSPVSPRCSSCVATGCTFSHGGMDVYFFPVTKNVSHNMCTDEPAGGIENSATITPDPDSTYTEVTTGAYTVVNNITMYEGNVYLSLTEPHVRDSCGNTVEPQFKRPRIITMASSDLFSVRGYPHNVIPYSIDYADFNDPTPWSAYVGGWYCWNNRPACSEIFPGNYYPVMSMPGQIRQLDPNWASCEFDKYGIFDPPIALHSVANFLTSSAAASPTPSSVEPIVSATPGQTSNDDSPTATSAPTQTARPSASSSDPQQSSSNDVQRPSSSSNPQSSNDPQPSSDPQSSNDPQSSHNPQPSNNPQSSNSPQPNDNPQSGDNSQHPSSGGAPLPSTVNSQPSSSSNIPQPGNDPESPSSNQNPQPGNESPRPSSNSAQDPSRPTLAPIDPQDPGQSGKPSNVIPSGKETVSIATPSGSSPDHPDQNPVTNTNAIPASPAITIGPTVMPVDPTGGIIVQPGTTLSNGDPPVVVGSSTFNIGIGGLTIISPETSSEIPFGTEPVTIPVGPSSEPAVFDPSASTIVLGGTTLSQGGDPVTVGDNTLTAGPSGVVVVGISGTTTIALPTASPTSAAVPQAVTVGSDVLTVSGDSVVIGTGTTLNVGGTAAIISGATLSMGPDGLVIVSGERTTTVPGTESSATAGDYVASSKALSTSASSSSSSSTSSSTSTSTSATAEHNDSPTETSNVGFPGAADCMAWSRAFMLGMIGLVIVLC